MQPHIRITAPTLGTVALEKAEALLGVELPEPYRTFLLQHNGGQPVPDRFIPADSSEHEVLAWFISVADRDDGLVALAKTYRPYLHPNLLPIASDPFGNLICLGVRGDQMGQVFFWLHETALAPGEPLPNTGCRGIADSFTAFMGSFVEGD